MPCYIHRVEQLCGDTVHGTWNTTEMYPLTNVGGGNYMGKMPNLDTVVNWLPVDFADDYIVDIMMKIVYSSPASAKNAIFQIVNPNKVSWASVLDSMKLCGMKFDVVDPETWVQELSLHQDNPAYKIFSFCEKQFKNNSNACSEKWEIINTSTLATSMNSVPTVRYLLLHYLNHWKDIGFII